MYFSIEKVKKSLTSYYLLRWMKFSRKQLSILLTLILCLLLVSPLTASSNSSSLKRRFANDPANKKECQPIDKSFRRDDFGQVYQEFTPSSSVSFPTVNSFNFSDSGDFCFENAVQEQLHRTFSTSDRPEHSHENERTYNDSTQQHESVSYPNQESNSQQLNYSTFKSEELFLNTSLMIYFLI